MSTQLPPSHIDSLDVASEGSETLLTLITHCTAQSQPALVTPSHASNKRSHSLDRDTAIINDGYTDLIGRKSKRKISLSSTGSRLKRKGVKDALDSCDPNINHSNRLCVFCAEETLPDSSVKCDFCQESYHLACCNPDTVSTSYTDTIKLLEFLGWTCRACRSSASHVIDNLRSSIASLSADFISFVPHSCSELLHS